MSGLHDHKTMGEIERDRDRETEIEIKIERQRLLKNYGHWDPIF